MLWRLFLTTLPFCWVCVNVHILSVSSCLVWGAWWGGLSQVCCEVWRLWKGVERPEVLEMMQCQGNGLWVSGKRCWWCLYHSTPISLCWNMGWLCDSEVSQVFHLREVCTFLMDRQWKRNSFFGAYYVLGLIQRLKYIILLNLTNAWKIGITAILLLLALLLLLLLFELILYNWRKWKSAS